MKMKNPSLNVFYWYYFQFQNSTYFLYTSELFQVIQDPNVKLEPRDQSLSPFQLHPGNYRDISQATPSPQPLSPQMFVQGSQSPLPYQLPQNILQNQLIGTTSRMTQFQNNLNPQQPNHIFTNIPPGQTFATGTSAIWSNNLNGVEVSGMRTYTNMQTSNIFDQPMPIQNNTQNFQAQLEPMNISSSLFDLDGLKSLSSELKLFSLSEFDSFAKTEEKPQNNSNIQQQHQQQQNRTGPKK